MNGKLTNRGSIFGAGMLLVSLTIGLALMSPAAQAQTNVLVDFNFNSSYTTNPYPADFVTNGLSSTDFQVIGGVAEASTQPDAGFTTTDGGQAYIRGQATGSNQAAALADDDYFTFTLTADGGKFLDLESIQLNLDLDIGIVYVVVNDSLVGTTSGQTSFVTPWDSSFNALIDLSSVANTTQAVFEIRFSDSSDASSTIQRMTNLGVNGLVIPEPSSWMLVLGGLGLLVIRRRLFR